MSSSRPKGPAKPKKVRTLTPDQLQDWLASLDPPAPCISMLDGYLSALVVSPQFIPPDDWLPPIVGAAAMWAPEGSVEDAATKAIFRRYNEIGSTLSGGPRRYAPIYRRTDEGEVLLEQFANGFYTGMQLSIDDWKPILSDRELGMALTTILGHCTMITSQDERVAVIGAQGAQMLAQSWPIVREIVEMLHVRIAGARNIEIR